MIIKVNSLLYSVYYTNEDLGTTTSHLYLPITILQFVYVPGDKLSKSNFYDGHRTKN